MRSIWSRADLNERGRHACRKDTIFLAASVGETSVEEACEKLGISRQRFYKLEDRAVTDFLRALQPRPAGRPSRPRDTAAPLQGRIAALEKENKKLWLYVKVLRKLAGIEDRGKKAGRGTKDSGRGDQTHGR